MKPAASSNDGTGIVGYGATGSKKPYLVSFRFGKYLTFETWGPTIGDKKIGKPVADQWNHVAMTYDGNKNIKFFLDGVESPEAIDTQGDLMTPASGAFVIGGEVDNNEGMTGSIKDVQVYDSVLSAAEVQEVKNMA